METLFLREHQANDGDYADPFWVPCSKKKLSLITAVQVVNAFNNINQGLQQREDNASSEDQYLEPIEEFPYWWFIEPTI